MNWQSFLFIHRIIARQPFCFSDIAPSMTSMARFDLLLSIIRADTQGNQSDFRRALEAFVAEERARQSSCE